MASTDDLVVMVDSLIEMGNKYGLNSEEPPLRDFVTARTQIIDAGKLNFNEKHFDFLHWKYIEFSEKYRFSEKYHKLDRLEFITEMVGIREVIAMTTPCIYVCEHEHFYPPPAPNFCPQDGTPINLSQ